MQEDKITDWSQLAQRAFQDFFGFGKALSAPEKQEVKRAANAEPWVHMVSELVPCISAWLHTAKLSSFKPALCNCGSRGEEDLLLMAGVSEGV